MLRSRLLGLLQAARVARLGVDGAAVQVVRAGGDHGINVARVGEGDKSEAPRAARLGVLHDDTVDDLAETCEVAEERLLGRVPTESAEEELPLLLVVVSALPRRRAVGMVRPRLRRRRLRVAGAANGAAGVGAPCGVDAIRG